MKCVGFLLLFVTLLPGILKGQQLASEFLPVKTIAAVHISPVGDKIAVLASFGSHDRIEIRELVSNNFITGYETPRDLFIGIFAWLGNDHVVFEHEQREEKSYFKVPEGRVFYIDAATPRAEDDPGRAIQLGRNRGYLSFNLLPSPIDDRLELIERPLLRPGRFDNKNGGIFRPYLANRFWYRPLAIDVELTGRNGSPELTREQFGPFENGEILTNHLGELSLAFRSRGDMDFGLHIYRAAEDRWEDISDSFELGLRTLKFDVDPLGFNSDGSKFYFLKAGKFSTIGVYIFDVAAMSYELLHEYEQFDIYQENLIYSIDGKELVGISHPFADNKFIAVSTHPDTNLFTELFERFPQERVELENTSRDLRKLILKVSGPNRPGDFYLVDRESDEPTLLAGNMSEEARQDLSPVEIMKVTTPNNQSLFGVLTSPRAEVESKGLIIFPNAYASMMFAKPEYDPVSQFLASHGYSSLRMNVRGASGFGRHLTYLGWGEAATGMVDDILFATQLVKQERGFSSDRTCLFGEYWGAMTAFTAMIRESQEFACGVLISGVYDLEEQVESYGSQGSYGEIYTANALAVFDWNRNALRDNSPINNIDKLNTPLLVIDTESFHTVDYSLDMRRMLDRQNIDHEWYMHDREFLSSRDPGHKAAILDRVLSFIEEHTSREIVLSQ